MSSVNTSMGIKSFKVAEATENSGVYSFPTSGVSIGDVYQDTCQLVDEAPEITTHKSETSNRKIIQTGETVTTIELSLMDPDLDTLAKYFGGSVSGDKWERPRELPYKEFAIQLEPDAGMFVGSKAARIVPRFEITYSSTGICLVPVTITLIEPLEISKDAFFTA